MIVFKKACIIYCLLIVPSLIFAQTLIDNKATKRTQRLYKNMHKMAYDSSVMFGHQDDLAYGIGWKNIKGRSDLKNSNVPY